MNSTNLQHIYSRRFDAQEKYRNRVWRVLVDDFFQALVPADGAVLDMGCGYGQFINNIAAAKKFAMDLNPQAQQHLAKGVTLFQQDCSTAWPLPDKFLDVVFSSNFFEHLPSKPSLEDSIRQAARCLKPGGRLIAMGPNARIIPGAYWDFWDHHIPLPERAVVELFEINGFTIDRAVARFLPYTMVNKRESPLLFLKIYIRVPLVWQFFGHQFLVVGRKSETVRTSPTQFPE
jgi:SAM-dependent methyltransferase